MSTAPQDTIHPNPTDPPRPDRRTRRRLLAAGAAVLVVVLAVVAALLLRPGDDEGAPGGDPAEPTAGGRTIDVLESGAVGDGRTDDTEALQAAFDGAEAGDVVLLAEGSTFAHDDLLEITSPGVTVSGGGTLLATAEDRSSLTIAADDVVLDGVVLEIVDTTRRFEAYEQQRLRIDGHSGVVVRDVLVDGSAAAGVYVGGATSDFLLERVHVRGTRADGIHMTQGAHDGRVVEPLVEDVGDDGVAVVSYAQDGDPCARIEVVSPVVDTTSGGRGISVVGGEDITYRDIDVRGTYAAAVYVSAEGSFDTAGVDGVVVEGGVVSRANASEEIDHGSVLVFNGTQDEVVRDVRVSGLEITATRASASREVGLLTDRDDGIEDVVLEDLSFGPDGPEMLLVSPDPTTTYTAEGWTHDGEDVPDRQDEVVEYDD